MDTAAALRRQTFFDVLSDARIDPHLTATLYTVESGARHNPIADDVVSTLTSLHGAGLRLAVLSDIHFDLRRVRRRWAGRGHRRLRAVVRSGSSEARSRPVRARPGGTRDAGPRDADGRRPRWPGRIRRRAGHHHLAPAASGAPRTAPAASRADAGRAGVQHRTRATTGTLRSQLIAVPGRLARSARRLVLHLPQLALAARLRATPVLTVPRRPGRLGDRAGVRRRRRRVLGRSGAIDHRPRSARARRTAQGQSVLA